MFALFNGERAMKSVARKKRSAQEISGVYVLQKKSHDAKNVDIVKEARRGGLLGTDRAGGW